MDDATATEDPRAATARENGKAGGCPPGKVHADRRTWDSDYLVEAAANAAIQGKIPSRGTATELNYQDKAILSHMAGMPAEAFAAELTATLQVLAKKTGQRIMEKLDNNEGKLSELSYLYAVEIDKLNTLSGRSQTHGANVNVQINVNPLSRQDLMSQLKGDKTMEAAETIG